MNGWNQSCVWSEVQALFSGPKGPLVYPHGGFHNGCSSEGFIAFRTPCSTGRLRTIGWDKIHKKVWWMGETRALFDLRFRPKGLSSIPIWRLPQWLFIRGLYSFSRPVQHHRALENNRVNQNPSKSFDECPELEWKLMTANFHSLCIYYYSTSGFVILNLVFHVNISAMKILLWVL